MTERSIEQWKTQGDTPSYLWEMLTSQGNIYAGLSAAALGTVLSIPFGFAVGLIPVVCFAAAEVIASMFVPNSMKFRQSVDLKYRRKRRENVRRHLLDELVSRLPEDSAELSVYQRMLDRIQSLRAIAANRSSSMTESDIERLDDACVDYLALLLAKVLSEERARGMDSEALRVRAETIHAQLKGSKNMADRRTLQKARDDVEILIERYRRLELRKTAIETALLAMPDTLEEIYHNMITNPNASNAADSLQSAVERLRLEEELDYAIAREVDAVPPLRRVMAASSALTKAKG
ncbi:MAG: hypothetical protein ABFS02_05400 [Pseudomonadota bacterium]